MSYELKKPFTDQEYADFVVEYNHKKGLNIEETENAIFALEQNEIMGNGIPITDSTYNEKIMQKRKEKFESEFFETSLGWIRRKVLLKNGEQKDFLSDMLMPIKVGIDMGQEVRIITYRKPNFCSQLTENYLKTLQEERNATYEFINECLNQIVNDFGV